MRYFTLDESLSLALGHNLRRVNESDSVAVDQECLQALEDDVLLDLPLVRLQVTTQLADQRIQHDMSLLDFVSCLQTILGDVLLDD